ncbi:BatD family protein [Shewanella donghaensis]|uniref:BatD family protein n=1 Tax=Shewanella donghaensis TaxID=238836 RepID=UPI001182BF69|nr:BatD family protein [Shewanella donghaensis]
MLLFYRIQAFMCRCMILALIGISPSALAMTVGELQAQKTLSIETWLSTETNSTRRLSEGENSLLTVAVGEQLTLNIQVGSNRWFTRGTQISAVELPNVMSKQREQFSVNSTKRINGETWSFQLWQISLFPQASGRYEVPILDVSIEVMSPSDGKVAGMMVSQTQRFDAILPNASLVDNNWFSSSEVSVEQQWQQSNPELYVGDSLTRVITTNAADTLSVLLPNTLPSKPPNTLSNKSSKKSSGSASEQFQAYSDPVQLQDTEQRGDYLSSRIDKQVYIVQQGGKIVFPDVIVSWWDTKNQQLQQQVLAGQTVTVKHTLASWLTYYGNTLMILVLIFIGLLGVIICLVKYYQQHAKPMWWRYINAVRTKSWSQARGLLYKKVRQTNAHLTLARGIKSQNQKQALLMQQETDELEAKKDKPKRHLAYELWFAVSEKESQSEKDFFKRKFKRLSQKIFPKALPQLEKTIDKKQGYKHSG